jgi:predicted Zn-dependent protease
VRLIIALVIAAFAVISYFARPGDVNQITGEIQKVAMPEEGDEIQMGLAATREMSAQFGGPDRDQRAQDAVRRIGEELLVALDESLEPGGHVNPYRRDFHFTLLADDQTVNAFALPGGQIFITRALLSALKTEGQLAGVLGHEIGHVIERHSNQQMAKQGLLQGLAAAGGVAGGSQQSAQMAQAAAQIISMSYGREAESESDEWAVRLTVLAGYDPRSMIGVMDILQQASGGRGAGPDFFSTHPNPEKRKADIEKHIAHEFPRGLPPGLKP